MRRKKRKKENNFVRSVSGINLHEKLIKLQKNMIFEYRMVSSSERQKMNRMYAKIKEFGVIGRTELQKECGNMPIATYNKLKPYFEELYEGKVDYDKQKKIWFDIAPQTEEAKTHIEKTLEMLQVHKN